MTDAAATRRMPRRRVLTLLAASAAMANLPAVSATGPGAIFEWRGTALGARVRMLFAHDDESAMRRAVERTVAEIDRIENIFSLCRPESELCRLNRDGSIAGPSLDLVGQLTEAVRLGDLAEGAFDVTVQPLWNLYREHFARQPSDPTGPPPRAIAAARALVDYRRIAIAPGRISLESAGMAVTLNGIAQGYVTDRVADMLRGSGFAHVLIDLGEVRAMGHPPGATGWPVRLGYSADHEEASATLLLADRAVATSSGAASVFDATGRHHHLFDPATGASARLYQGVSVIAGRAALADGLSTALAILPPDRGTALLDRIGDVRAWRVTADGELLTYPRIRQNQAAS